MRTQLWEEEDSVQLYPGPTHGSSDTIGRGRRGKAPYLAVLFAQNAWLRQSFVATLVIRLTKGPKGQRRTSMKVVHPFR